MAKYIPLDDVLAEIEKIIADETESIKCFERRRNVSEVQRSNARIGVLTHLRSRLNTLEVKEVDLEKEIVDGWKTIHNAGNDIPFDTFNGIATHFFERGMRFSAVGSDYIEGVRGYCETTTK